MAFTGTKPSSEGGFGRRYNIREDARQVEAIVGCKILNRCLELGVSKSVRVG